MLSCTWNNSEAPLCPVLRHRNPGCCSLSSLPGSRAPLDHPGWQRGMVPGLAGTQCAVTANNSEEELAPAGAANPGQPSSPPTAQKQLKVAHRGHCEE